MRRSESEQRILRSFEASRAGRPRDKSERKGDGGVRPREVKRLVSRPVLCSSAVAYTVGNGLRSRERRKEAHKERGKQFADLQTRPTRVYLYVFQRQVLYCRTIRMNHEGESRGQNVASTKLLQNRENRSMKGNQE